MPRGCTDPRLGAGSTVAWRPKSLLRMHKTMLTSETLSRLNGLETGGNRVLSLYLSFDPSQTPNIRERRIEADSLLGQLERRYLDDEQASHAQRTALREDIESVRAFLTDGELAPESAHGLAIFCSAPAGILEVVSLPGPVDPGAVVGERPFIGPLAELVAPERWCVLLISHRASRIFRGPREHLAEVSSALDDVHRRHAQGGWSQARYQRGIEKETDDHIRSSCLVLFERFKRRAFDRLLIAGPSELHHRVEHELHPDLQRRLAGHFEIDVERATPEEVRRRAAPGIEADARRTEDEGLKRLLEGLAPDGHAAVGLDTVLERLSERRVGTMLIAHGFTAPGFTCPSCGRLAASGASPSCPVDGSALEPRADIVERAIELALDQSAEILVVRQRRDELDAHGSIGALVRF
jgi:peptide chain release factor subunit 1